MSELDRIIREDRQERGMPEPPEWSDYFPPEREFDEGYDQNRTDWLVNTNTYKPEDLSPRYGEAVKEYLSQYSGKNIADLGSCYYSGVAAIAGDENNVVQVDIKKYPLEILSEYKDVIEEEEDVKLESDLAAADAKELPFKDNSFDVIFAGAAVQTLWDRTDTRRVLSSGGDLIATSKMMEDIDEPYAALEEDGLEHLKDWEFENAETEDSVVLLENYQG